MKQCRGRVGVALTLAAMLTFGVAGCGSNSKKNNTNAPNGGAAGSPAAQTGARSTAAAGANRSFAKAPAFTIDTNRGYTATIKTDKGDITVTLNAKAAPLTVNNFVFLARQHFYDGLTCHRVIAGFVAQCGDPQGNGSGGPGYSIPDEKSPLLHGTGAIAMAKSNAPNSAGSQFYITLTPQPALDDKYTVFGQVTAGMDVVNQLTPRDPQTATAPGDRIVSITIAETSVTPTPFVAGTPAAGPLRSTATPVR